MFTNWILKNCEPIFPACYFLMLIDIKPAARRFALDRIGFFALLPIFIFINQTEINIFLKCNAIALGTSEPQRRVLPWIVL